MERGERFPALQEIRSRVETVYSEIRQNKRLFALGASALALLDAGIGVVGLKAVAERNPVERVEAIACTGTDITCYLQEAGLDVPAVHEEPEPTTMPATPVTTVSPPPAPHKAPVTEKPKPVPAPPPPLPHRTLQGLRTIGLSTLTDLLGRGSGIDISYPNCNAVIPQVGFGIIGVNGGRNFKFNPCLREEADRVMQASGIIGVGLYINSENPDNKRFVYPDYPKGSNSPECQAQPARYCSDYNAGFNAAKNAVEYAGSLGLRSTVWAIDVEPIRQAKIWSDDPLLNRRSIHGQIDALNQFAAAQAGQPVEILIYGNQNFWNRITDNWQINYPVWLASGRDSVEGARQRCAEPGFTGGKIALVQLVAQPPGYAQPLDINLAC
jgi:hypothetical protein